MTDCIKAKGPSQVISEKKVKLFVLDVVNAPDRQPSADNNAYLFRCYSKFLPSISNPTALLPLIASRIERRIPLNDLLPDAFYAAIIVELRDRMQEVWEAEDEYTAEWRIFTLQLTLYRVMLACERCDSERNRIMHADERLQPPPLDEPIQKAFNWLRVNFHTLRKCSNPNCLNPYFSASRGQQQYCSEQCSAVGQSKSKSKWWSEKGQEWREAKRKQANMDKPQVAKKTK